MLAGKPLAEYCVWRQGLSADEGRQWDQLLSSLNPDNSMQRLDAFRFSGDPPPATAEEKPKSLADKPRELIQAGLEGR